MQLMTQWLVLLVALPPHPSSVRVRVWRKLRALGAVALKKAVYILPFTAENLEQFQWLTQEIQKARGEATLLKVDQIENMTRADVVRRFQEAREQDYQALAAGYRKVAQRLERATSGRGRAAVLTELARLARELERVHEIDFFDAPGGEELRRLRDTLEMRLEPRAAAAPGGGDLAQIVHEVDLRDDKYRRAEARGIDLAIRGLLAALKDDHEALAHGLTLFDGLYAAMRAGRR